MHLKQFFLIVLIFSILAVAGGCSSEPATTEECLDAYMKNVENEKAAGEIERACRQLFDADAADDRYSTCILKSMAAAETDEDVNIILRRCTIDR